MMVMTAVTSHAPMSRAGDPVVRLMSAGTRKIPEPIIGADDDGGGAEEAKAGHQPGLSGSLPFFRERDGRNGLGTHVSYSST